MRKRGQDPCIIKKNDLTDSIWRKQKKERENKQERENMHINKGNAGQEISKHMYKLNLEQIKTKYPLFNTMVHMNA